MLLYIESNPSHYYIILYTFHTNVETHSKIQRYSSKNSKIIQKFNDGCYYTLERIESISLLYHFVHISYECRNSFKDTHLKIQK